MNSHDEINPLDAATSARLAKLAAMPMDTARLEKAIEAKIPRPIELAPVFIRMRALRAVAAGIVLMGMIGMVLWGLSGTTVMASMAQLHNDLLSGKVHATQVNSIAEASKALSVDLPDVPAEHVMMCCMHSIKDPRIACVVLKSDNVPITLAVAKAAQMKMPESQTVTYNSSVYHVQSRGDLNMVMTEKSGQWICLIGALKSQRLMEIASAIQF